MKASVILAGVLTLWVGLAHGRPGHFFYTFPSSQTHVARDALGNQHTAYAYDDGHSSSVSVSRSDVSKHLTYVPVPVVAPVVHTHLAHAAHPAIYDEAVPVLAAASPDYHSYASYAPSYYGGGYYL